MVQSITVSRLILLVIFIVSTLSPQDNEMIVMKQVYEDQVNQLILNNDEFISYVKLVDEKMIEEIEKSKIEVPKTERLQIVSVGDIMCHSPQFKSVYKDGKYDFTKWFDPVKEYIENGDLAIANLETTFSGADKKYSGYPGFNTPEELGIAIKEAGFDILTTANNHSLDRRNYGVVSTLNELDKLELKHTGTYRNEEERTILIEETNGIKIAFMSYTYGTNGIPIPKENPSAVNIINKKKMP